MPDYPHAESWFWSPSTCHEVDLPHDVKRKLFWDNVGTTVATSLRSALRRRDRNSVSCGLSLRTSRWVVLAVLDSLMPAQARESPA